MSEPKAGCSYYIVNVGHEKFLNTEGDAVTAWRRSDTDVNGTIATNTSEYAGNIRWRIVNCPQSPDSVYVVNVRHEKFLDTQGSDVTVAEQGVPRLKFASDSIRWRLVACPHQAGAYYIISVMHSKFLDCQDKVCVWRHPGADVESTIARNTSRSAGNIRWLFIPCPADKSVEGRAPRSAHAEESGAECMAIIPREFACCGAIGDPGCIRIMQFNVLADGLGQAQFGRHMASDILAFTHRSRLALKEIQRVLPDVLCMQEVNHFDSWRAELHSMGYEGIFMPKYDASYPADYQHTPVFYHGAPTDGCALFVRSERVKIRSYLRQRFADITGMDTMSQVFICAALESSATGEALITVSLSHLKAGGGDENAQMRLVQAQAWAKELLSFADKSPLVVCGDMNEDLRKAPAGGVATLCKMLGLSSAYALGLGRDPPYTCIDGSWRGCLDYILVSEGILPCMLLEVPDLPDGALPSPQYPSDHLALAAELGGPFPPVEPTRARQMH